MKKKMDEEKDEYGMTEEDYKEQYKNNLKKIAMVYGICLGIPFLTKKIVGE